MSNDFRRRFSPFRPAMLSSRRLKLTPLLLLLVTLFAAASLCSAQGRAAEPIKTNSRFLLEEGAIVRADKSTRKLALVFTGDEFADGAETIIQTLKRRGIKASFFFTGRFYRNPNFKPYIERVKRDGHYLGAHSDQHLLYCDWSKRDELLVSRKQFEDDLNQNYEAMLAFRISKSEAPYFLPPF